MFQEKVERKLSINPYLGLVIFPPSALLANNDIFTQQKNLFQDFKPGPMIGCAAYLKLKKRILVGADGSFFASSRELNSMNTFNLSLIAKITMLNSSKSRFSPFLILGVNSSFVNYNQKSTTITETDTLILNQNFGGNGIQVTQVAQNFGDPNLRMAPMIGPIAGVGLDIKISRKISLFTQATLQTTMVNALNIQQYFEKYENNPLGLLAFKAGITVRLFKKMKFETDSDAVRVPDPIIALSPPDDDVQPAQMLSREASFAVNIREGTKHNVQVTAQNGEINIDMDRDTSTSPCPVLAVLYDEFGNKIATQKPDKEGKVNFKGLENGNFNVAFELQPPCKEADFTYKVNEGKIKGQHNSTYDVSKDSLTYNVEGFLEFKDKNAVKENVTVMLVDKNSKTIKSRQSTKSNGSFAFTNIKPGNYKVVYDVGNPKIQSRMEYEIRTNRDSLVNRVDFPFNELKSKSSEGTRLMAGKLELSDRTIAAYKVNLDLVDKYNRVIDRSIPNKDGTFEFIDKASEKNDIIYEMTDKKMEKNDTLVKSVSYEPKTEFARKMAEKKATEDASASVTKPVYSGAAKPMEVNSIYDLDGNSKTIVGFAFQVGSFRNLAYVQQMMAKMKNQGYEVYVQPVESGGSASRFKTSQSYVFNRVIVFGSPELDAADVVKNKLIKDGYEIIVKEKFAINAPTKK
ncbi:MAG: hypothetical protein EAZ53_07275 [Bacteroidetes bacterium]|nr:MAG: hypothetical protein EAZ53_07275 [Bacteroidota bacterium]